MLLSFADWITFTLLRLSPTSALGSSMQFFVYDTVKIFLLLIIITHGMSLLRIYLPVSKMRNFLHTRRLYGLEYLFASVFGAITPFCSCSSIPLFIGFLQAGIPLGVTFAFLITSPLVNEVAVVLFLGIFGWKVTLLYAVAGILIGTVGGIVLGRMKMENEVRTDMFEEKKKPCCCCKNAVPQSVLQKVSREAWGIIRKVMPFVAVGVAIGAIIHGYVPDGTFRTP
jgi:uncharacterized membrane protein YraQ (UPF0718 family)